MKPRLWFSSAIVAGIVITACGDSKSSPSTTPPTLSPSPFETGSSSPPPTDPPTSFVTIPPPLPTNTPDAFGMVPFTDPYIGYSFSYPESWFFDPPRGPTQLGWAGILTSWNTVGLERPPDGTVVKKIDIMTSPNSQHRTLDEFLASLDPENVTVLSSETISLGGIPANRQEIFLHNTESHLTAITAVHGDWIFQINAYWEPYDVLQLVLDSFRFEESP